MAAPAKQKAAPPAQLSKALLAAGLPGLPGLRGWGKGGEGGDGEASGGEQQAEAQEGAKSGGFKLLELLKRKG